MIQKIDYTMPNVFQLANIEKECFGRDAWSISALRGEFTQPYAHMWGWVEDGKIVGYICVHVMYEEAQVCNIAVLPQYRRKGIASALIAAMESFCLDSGCERSELEVNTANEQAVSLYKKCGYEVAGIRKNYYPRSRYSSKDGYTMVKNLK